MKVSVLLLAYNHESFIAKSIESVLMQQADFEYEIIIGEDFSTDRTREILLAYQTNYPNKIRLILSPKNLGVTRNFAQVFKACKGEYIATLEGDDYWTSPHKLQIQSDFLDSNPHFAMCFTNASIVDEKGNLIKNDRVPEDKRKHLTQREIVSGYCPPANTVMFRQHLIKEIPEVFYEIINADFFLFSTITEHGDAGYIDIKTAHYRMQGSGVWACQTEEYHHRNNLKTRMALLSVFKHKYDAILSKSIKGSYDSLVELNKKKVKNIVISGTNFWNPGDDFVRDGIINILRKLFYGCNLNFLFYNFNADFFPQSKFSGISNMVSKGDLDKYCQFIDAVVVAGLSAGTEIKDLYNWVISNSLQDRVYLIGAGYENNYVDRYIYEEPEATIFKEAKIIIGRTKKTPKFISGLNLPYYHINCPAILSVENVKNVPSNKKIEKIAFSIQLPCGVGIANHDCHESMYKLAVGVLLEVHTKYQVEVIAHHKTEYFHFLNLLKDISVPVIFSSFYQDLYEIYARYDLVVTTRLHSSLFANGHGIPGIILNDTDRHTHCLEGFPHSVCVNTKEKFHQQFENICNQDLQVIAREAKEFKDKLMGKYIDVLAKSFGIEFQRVDTQTKNPETLSLPENCEQKVRVSDTKELINSKTYVLASIASEPTKDRECSIVSNLQKELLFERDINPIHFFTIVLNGEPFIRHHIEVFKKLPFKWHWHIIEGVADLKYDTAWSLQFGGRIANEIHQNGLSNDGTTEYLDELKQQYPENITIYRKPNGDFWDGKLEMVNAPFININEECLLWQVDADELWTVEQICTMRSMFIQRPDKTAAYYLCHYYVGENLVITTRDTYGNNTSYEWLRTWRFKPGFRWISHEPPCLCQQTQSGQWIDVATMNPFMHKETEAQNLIYHHHAYVLEKQLRFKEVYYGYRNAVEQWKELQRESKFPVALKNYFVWVKDSAQVNTVQSQNIHPIVQRRVNGQSRFEQHDVPATEVQNVLWIRTDSIGDNVLASSMLPYIQEKYRSANITVVCQEHIAELYESCPFVYDVIRYNKSLAYEDEQYRADILRKLRSLNADRVLNSVYSREPLTDAFTIGSGAKESLAFNGNLCNISVELRDKHNQFYTRLLKSETEHKPELARHKDYLKGLGIDVPYLKPIVWTTPKDEKFAEEFFLSQNLNTNTTIALFPGAQHFHKEYPQYDNVLQQMEHFNFIILGGQEVTAKANNFPRILRGNCYNLVGKTTIRQMASIIRRCKLYVGSDSAGAHIASAVGTPNIVILGGGHFGRFMPYSPLTSVVCLPLECYGCNWNCKYQTVHCVKDVIPEVIEEAVRQTLENNSGKPRVFVQGSSLWNPQPNQPQWQWFNKFIDTNSVEIIPVGDVPPLSKTEIEIPVVTSQQSVALLNIEAKQELQNGNISGAKELLLKILEQSPNNIKALNNLAVTNILGKNWDSATDILQKVLQLDPTNKISIENNKYLEIQMSLQKSILDAENFIKSKQYPQAREILEKVLEINDKHIDALNDIAVIEISQNNYREAQELLNNILQIDASNEIAKNNLNCINKYLGSYSKQDQTIIPTIEDKYFFKISVVTPSFNQVKYIEQTIKSVLEQNYPNFEHIIIDGGSTDGTVEILKKYPHIKWLSEKDLGQSDAINKGFQMVLGDIIAWINSDDWYESNTFRIIADYFVNNPGKNIVMGNCNLVDEKGNVFDTVINYERGFDKLKMHWIPRSIPTQPAIFFRKKLLDEFGCLDISLHYAMDYDLWMRFAKENIFYHINQTFANYRFHSLAKGGDQDWNKFIPECKLIYKRYVKTNTSPQKVSVIIPCCNHGCYLPDAVNSVLCQTYQDLEIIIVNDGSIDNTIQIAESLICKYPDKLIRLINQVHQGPSMARNTAIKASKGVYILPLDADDLIHSEMLHKTVSLLDNHPEIAIAYTDVKHFGSANRIVSTGEYDFKRLCLQNHLNYCALFRREAWESAGGYNPNMALGYEDWDFWISCGEKGYYGKRISEPLFMYRVKETSRDTKAREHHSELMAQIVINHPNIYDQKSLLEAKTILDRCSADKLKTAPLVSVMVPTYNRPDTLKKALESIALQNYKRIEAVVVNDAGEDVSSIVDAVRDRLTIKYLIHDKNKGLAAARNTAIKHASGQYIAYLDDDDIFYPEHIETALKVLTTTDYKVVYTNACRAFQKKFGNTYQIINKDVPYSTDYVKGIFYTTNITPVLCVVHDKTCLEEVGVFDESLPVLEDWDLWIRMAEKYDFYHIKKVTCEFSWRADGTSTTSSKQDEFARVRELIYKRYNKNLQELLMAQQTSSITTFPTLPRESVSIIILTWNALEYTKKCILSIQTHTNYPHEIIFVDNASTDGTVEYLRDLVRERPNYKLIENHENRGFAAGNNQGVSVARGDYVMLLNNDVLVSDGWLEGLVESLERDEKIGMVGPITNSVSGRQMVKGVPYTDENGFHDFAQKVRKTYNGRLTPRYRIAGFAVLIKKALYDEVGGLDESFGTGNYEDDDLCLKIRGKGYAIMVDESVFIHHYRSQTFIENKIDYRNNLSVNEPMFRKKWPNIDYEELLELHNNLVDENATLLTQGQQALDLGNIGEAIALYFKILNTNPIDEFALYGIGLASQMNGKTDEAIDAYKKTIKTNPSFYDAYGSLALIYSHIDQIDNAISVLKKAIELHNNDASAYNNLGVLYFKKNKRNDARICFEKALSIDVNYQEAQQNLKKVS